MDALLTRFTRNGTEPESLPTLDDVFLALTNPEVYPPGAKYLEARPDLRRGLERFAARVKQLSHEMIKVAAYYRFKERERRGEMPLGGRELEDWYAAERELLRLLWQTGVAA